MIDDDFLLKRGGKTAERLYNEVAKDLPVIDFHNHLSVSELSINNRYENITKLWISSDPYKHRLMRICGVEEKYITGTASDKEKFSKWCESFKKLIGNPLYHWSCLELKRVFETDAVPSVETCDWLWEYLNDKLLNGESFRPLDILRSFNVEASFPCAVPTEDVSHFKNIKGTYPSFRADELLLPDVNVVSKLCEKTGVEIKDIGDLDVAVERTVAEFRGAGCRFSDHAIDNGFRYMPDDGKNALRFKNILSGEALSCADAQFFTSHMLRVLGNLYSKYSWTAQYHIGAQRATSTRLRTLAGKAGGFAAIGNDIDIDSFTRLFDDIEKSTYGLPKTIIYTLDPSYNAAFSVLSGSYSKDGANALVSQGPAWWWCDHLLGMREVFDSISSYSLISQFVGMTTDSRSILSFSRHEYFRRAFCSYVGEKVMNGELPDDEALLKELVYNVCYGNAKQMIKEV